MAPLSASNLFVGSTSLTNLSSSRHRPPSLSAQREEGWTEVWGGKDYKSSDNGKAIEGGDDGAATGVPYLPARYITVIKDGCDFIHDEITTDSAVSTSRISDQDPSMLKLTQHRVAWFEQIVLRMNFIPHNVQNSGYSAVESTGGLPCLLDVSPKKEHEGGDGNLDNAAEWARALSKLNKPVLIGRNQPGGLGSYFFHHSHENSKSSSSPNLDPSWSLPSGSHIVDYLRLKHSHTMMDNLLFPEHLKEGGQSPGDAMAYEALIQEKLNYILLALRYGNDPAWDGVYRPQSIRAALDPNGDYAAANAGAKRKSFFPLCAWYQAYSERSLALHNLIPSTHTMSPSTHGGLALELFRYNDYRHSSLSRSSKSDEEDDDVEERELHQHHPFSSLFPSHGGVGGGDTGKVNVCRALEVADIYYASLEKKMTSLPHSDQSEQPAFFLGTEKPTYIDVLLFSHLTEALCDVHLVLVLSKHSRLMKYFQWMYDQYFGEDYTAAWQSRYPGEGASESADWIRKNNVVNALNSFNQIPEATSTMHSSKNIEPVDDNGHDMVHAIHLMQKMAVHCNELDEALRDAAALRTIEGQEKAVLESYHRPIGSRLYRWLMGGEISFWGSGQSKKNAEAAADDGINKDSNGDHDSDSQSGDGTDREPSPEEDDKQRTMREHVKRMKRDRRTHDEVWLSGVVVAVVAAFVISSSRRSKG
ncbi:hypothetical protein ACHAXR_011244 [Thalassiosira sp. AJA248-18]